MDISTRLNDEMVIAAKAKDKIRLSAIRMLKTALHNKEIDLMRLLNESETLQIIAAMVKQRKDSIEQFAKGGRTDLVEKEEAELKVVQEFMPAQMSDDGNYFRHIDHQTGRCIGFCRILGRPSGSFCHRNSDVLHGAGPFAD